MTRKIVAGICGAVILLLIWANEDGLAYTKADIIQQMRQQESSIKDIRVRYEYYTEQVLEPENVQQRLMDEFGDSFPAGGPLCETRECVFALKGDKVFFQKQEPSFAGMKKVAWAWDGQIVTQLDYAGLAGTVSSDTSCFELYHDTPFHFGGFCDSRRRALSDLIAAGETTLHSDPEVINGHSCVVVETLCEGKGRKKFWLDPQRGFRPCRLESFTSKGTPSIYKDIELVEYPHNIWFPAAAVHLSYMPRFRSDSSLEPELLAIRHCRVSDVEINSGLPDSLFRVNFPPGTEVYDMALETFYFADGSPISESSLNSLAETMLILRKPLSVELEED